MQNATDIEEVKRRIAHSRMRFFNEDIDPHGLPFVRDVVADSWVRSKEYGVDPTQKLGEARYQGKTFDLLKRNHLLLLRSAKPYLRRLESIVCNSDYMIVLYTADGVILEIMCSANLKAYASSLNIVPGAVFSEETVGTCANAVCGVLKQPILVRGAEHYSDCLMGTTCAAAPIMGGRNKALGVIAMESVVTEQQYGMTLGWVSAFAWAIENHLKMRANLDDTDAQNTLLRKALSASLGSYLAVDRDGCIILSDGELLSSIRGSLTSLEGRYLEDVLPSDELESAVFSPSDSRPAPVSVDVGETPCEATVFHEATRDSGAFAYIFLREQSAAQIDTPGPAIRKSSTSAHSALVGLFAQSGTKDCLIEGERGCGKRFVAKSALKECHVPFLEIDCRSVSEGDFSSRVDSFLEANARNEALPRSARFPLSQPHALLLGQVDALPLSSQKFLADALARRDSEASGPHAGDWFIVATSAKGDAPVPSASTEGGFLLQGCFGERVFEVKPLRLGHTEVTTLANRFLQEACALQGQKQAHITNAALSLLKQYQWPGNVSQLKNALFFAASMSDDGTVDAADLPQYVQRGNEGRLSSGKYVPLTLEELEKRAIESAVRNKQLSAAAKSLGISRTTLYRKMEKYGIRQKH